MNTKHRTYFLERARIEMEQAKASTDSVVAEIHKDMHRRYIEKADGVSPSVLLVVRDEKKINI